MASIVVDGLAVPVSLGHPVLDFCNTRAGWGEPTPKEYLRSHAHLSVWAAHVGVIASASPLREEADRRPEVAATVLTRAIRFRDALYRTLVGPGDWDGVNAEVRAAARAARLEPTRTWEIVPDDPLELPLLRVAWAAADLLTGPLAGRISACPGAGCGWLFANPHGRRRWCSMAWCGNRAKVRRHAERHR